MGASRQTAGAVAVCVILAAIHTWPLGSALGTLSRNDNADNMLNTWIIAWVAHQLTIDPLSLFDANIFHPEPRALAFSEPLIVPALMVAPINWAGGSVVLANNLALLAGMALTAFAGYLLAFRFTRDHTASLIAASLVAFNALTLTSVPQIQMQHGYGILFALLGFDMAITEPKRVRGAALLAASLVALALTSGYMAVLGLTAVTVAALVRAPELARRRALPAWRNLSIAAVAAAGIVAIVLAPYWWVYADQGLKRVPDTSASAIAASYLATGARVHYGAWSQPFSDMARVHLFVGFVPLALAVLAVVAARGRYLRRRARMLLGVALVGVFFSFGASNPVYMTLYQVVPPLQGLRIVARFGLLMLMCAGVLAAAGVLTLRRRYGARSWFPGVAMALLVIVNVEVLRAPRPYVEFEGIPPIYETLALLRSPAVVVEFPFPPADRNALNAKYMLASTVHWKPLLNGYSGFVPTSYRRRAESLSRFPDGDTLNELIDAGVTHIMIHSQNFNRGRRVARRLRRMPEVVLIDEDAEGRYLFAVRR